MAQEMQSQQQAVEEKASSSEFMAAAAVESLRYVDRRVVEYCTGAKSKLCDACYTGDGCDVVRLTITDDVTTTKGHAKAMAAVRELNCLLWASMPCGGSPWQKLSRLRTGGQAK
eukprot:8880085-Heterocapsa_arctica.AAC.1